MDRAQELNGKNTLPELLFSACKTWGPREALREYDRKSAQWQSVSYSQLATRIDAWRRSFAALGLETGDRVGILLPNGVHHVCADMAAMANGLIPVPLHAIDTPGACRFLLSDSGARVLVTNRRSRWEQIRAVPEGELALRHVVLTEEENEESDADRLPLLPLANFLHLGEAFAGEPPLASDPEAPACVIYTSGTTGRPKGVVLSQANIVANVRATLHCVSPKVGDVFLSFLPLSHMFERTAGYYLALATGCTIVYNRSVLLLAEDLRQVHPDVIISVPRIYEKIYGRIRKRLEKAGCLERTFFEWAVQTGWRDFARRNGIPCDQSGAWRDGFVRAFVLPKVSQLLLSQFGGKLRIAISGGAALNMQVAKLFCGLGLPIIQGYGMTETSPIIAGNSLEKNHPDTVGRPFRGVEVRLGEGDEIQVRGPSVTKSYWKRPDAVEAAFTEDGWFRTGDVGEFTPEGLLRIKGRIKEIIVTSTGEKIAPTDLENALETDPLFEQTYVVGENRPFLTLVAVLQGEEWKRTAEGLGLDPQDPASLSAPAAKTLALQRAKAAAKGFPYYALPRAVILTLEPWTVDNGLLTPTLKLKRGPLSKHFAENIEHIYARRGQAS